MENTVIPSKWAIPYFFEGKDYKTEQQLQALCVRWFSDELYTERGMLHCNNNNSTNRLEGNRNKTLGVYPGVSDLELLLPNGTVVFIELKLLKGKHSEDQLKWKEKVLARGHIYLTAYSFEDFINILKRLYE